MARDDAKLFKQEPVEGIQPGSHGSGHGDIMRLQSDKTVLRITRALPRTSRAIALAVRRNYMSFTFMSLERHECETHAVCRGLSGLR
jgi:hypothetical protein